MIGTLDRSSREVTVIGGGISGLLAAYYLHHAGMEVTLHEKEERPGGLIRTEETPLGISEAAAHSFLATPAAFELCEKLGVECVMPRERSRYVFRRGKPRKFPLTWAESFTAFRRALTTRAQGEDPTVEEWARHHLGDGALEYALDPFLTGIYASRPSEISMKAAFARLLPKEGETLIQHLQATRSQWTTPRMVAPRKGMGQLVGALEQHLRRELGARFRTGASAGELPRAGNVVLCVPAYAAADLLDRTEGELARALRRVIYVPLVSVTAFVPADQAPRIRGVGVLVPEKEQREALGILFNSSAFAGRASETAASYTVMFGGSRAPEWTDKSDEEIRDATIRALKELLGGCAALEDLRIWRWKRAVPQYSRDLVRTWELARATWCARPGRILFGNYTGQLSIRGMLAEVGRTFWH